MEFHIEKVVMGEVKVIRPEVFRDGRGFFSEVFREDKFKELGLPYTFVQDNHSGSDKGVLRGLHFQWDPPMGKLMRVTKGEAFLVAVDIRKNSPTLGEWFGIEASEENMLMLWAPACFARGFCVLSDYAEIQYKCSGIYNQEAESNIAWDDPEIGINWPVDNPVISARDTDAQSLSEWLKREESGHFTFTS